MKSILFIKLNNFYIFGTSICCIKRNRNETFNTIINTDNAYARN